MMKKLIILGVLISFIIGCHSSKKEIIKNEPTSVKFKSFFSTPNTFLSEEEMILLDSLNICFYKTKNVNYLDSCDERKYELVYIENRNDTLLVVASFFNFSKLGNSVLVYIKKEKKYELLHSHAADLLGFWIQEDEYVEMVTRSFSSEFGYVTLGHKWNGFDYMIDTIYSIDSGRLIDTDEYTELKLKLIDKYPFEYK